MIYHLLYTIYYLLLFTPSILAVDDVRRSSPSLSIPPQNPCLSSVLSLSQLSTSLPRLDSHHNGREHSPESDPRGRYVPLPLPPISSANRQTTPSTTPTPSPSTRPPPRSPTMSSMPSSVRLSSVLLSVLANCQAGVSRVPRSSTSARRATRCSTTSCPRSTRARRSARVCCTP